LVIDTAWAAVVLNRSKITPIRRVDRISDCERKECTLQPYFFFFFATFFFTAFFAFFAFIVVRPSVSHPNQLGQCQCENFWATSQTDFSADGYRRFR
jgi:hypothetical protein